MDEAKLEGLKDRARNLLRDADGLIDTAADFPALAKNAARIKASLAMIAISLGLDPETGQEP